MTTLATSPAADPDLLSLIAHPEDDFATRFKQACKLEADRNAGWVDPNLVRARLMVDGIPNPRQLSAFPSRATGHAGTETRKFRFGDGEVRDDLQVLLQVPVPAGRVLVHRGRDAAPLPSSRAVVAGDGPRPPQPVQEFQVTPTQAPEPQPSHPHSSPAAAPVNVESAEAQCEGIPGVRRRSPRAIRRA